MAKDIFIKWRQDLGSSKSEMVKPQNPNELTAKNLWDCSWLRERYPARYDAYYFAEWDMLDERQEHYQLMYGTGKK